MSDDGLLPLWDEVRRDYVEPGLPHRLVVRASPGLHVFTDFSASRLGARFELAADAPPAPASRLQQITVNDVSADGRRWLEVSATDPRLYESLYHLIAQIAGAVLEGKSPYVALDQSIEAWDSLVEQISLLSEERQAGLFGELLVLRRLLLNRTPDAVKSWVGPDRQAHDFRIGRIEFEVKTTGGSKRVHTINGIGQLQPSVDCALYLISIQAADAGSGGQSLTDLVNELRRLLPIDDIKEFDRRLGAYGYVERHAAHYTRRRRLRSDMAMIGVADGTPRLTADALASLPLRFAAERIGKIAYEIDVTDLGHADGTPEFLSIIPAVAGTS